jgi:nucleotide-binding universal stress UspA family protein
MTTADAAGHGNRIVVGVDGSEPSKAALRWALRETKVTGGTIDAIIAWQYPTGTGLGSLPTDWDPAADAATVLNQTVDEVFADGRPEGLRLLVEEGNASKRLLDASADAELLIVGSRGHGGFVGLLIGSVSATCAEHASCPVLVMHGS